MRCECKRLVACHLAEWNTIKDEATYTDCICRNCGKIQNSIDIPANSSSSWWVVVDRKLYTELNTKFNDKTIRQKLAQLYREAFGKQ